MCDLKRQQISLRTRHRNSRRTWIANLLYRFTGGRLILEGWHRIYPAPRRVWIKRIYFCTTRPYSSSHVSLPLQWRTRAVPNPSPPSYPSLSWATPLYIYIFFFSFSSPPPSLENTWFRSETNPANSGATVPRSKKELVIESVIMVRGFFVCLSFLLSIFPPPIIVPIRTYMCGAFVKLVWQRISYRLPRLYIAFRSAERNPSFDRKLLSDHACLPPLRYRFRSCESSSSLWVNDRVRNPARRNISFMCKGAKVESLSCLAGIRITCIRKNNVIFRGHKAIVIVHPFIYDTF